MLCCGCRLILTALEALEAALLCPEWAEACWLVMATFVPPYTRFPPRHPHGGCFGNHTGVDQRKPCVVSLLPSSGCSARSSRCWLLGDTPALFADPAVTAEAFSAKQLPSRNSPIRFWNDLIRRADWALHFFFISSSICPDSHPEVSDSDSYVPQKG